MKVVADVAKTQEFILPLVPGETYAITDLLEQHRKLVFSGIDHIEYNVLYVFLEQHGSRYKEIKLLPDYIVKYRHIFFGKAQCNPDGWRC